MRYLKGILVSAASLALLSGCGLKQADYASENATLSPDAIQMWQSPIVNTPELSLEKQTGFSGKTCLLGIPIGGDWVQGETAFVYDNVGSRKLKGLAAVAAGRAIDSADADGLYVTRMTAERTGIVPILYKIDYTVSGYPVSIEKTMTVDPEDYAKVVFEKEDVGVRTFSKAQQKKGGLLGFLPF